MGRNRDSLLTGLLCGILLMAVALPSRVLASSGQLDRSFGSRGRVVADIEFGNPRFWYAVKVRALHLPDDGILVAGNNLMLRYLSDGRLNKRFGEGGVLRVDTVEGQEFELSGLAIDSEGRIIVAGTSLGPPGAQKAAVFRFTSSGVLDPSFGGGDGSVVTDFGVQPLPNGSMEHAPLLVTGVAVDGSDRVVLSGAAIRAHFSCTEEGGFVGRLTAAGSVDPSFGANGVILYDASILHSAEGLVLDRSGAPFFFGRDGYCHGDGSPSPNLINRRDTNGLPDNGFGQEGQVVVSEYPRGLAVDRWGRIVVLQVQSLLRLLPSGALDRSFGQNGRAATSLRGEWSGWDGLAVDRNGGVLVTGHEARYFGGAEPRRRLALSRLTPSGTLDRSFGDAGMVRTPLGSPSNTVGRQVLLDGRGHAIVVGIARNRRLSSGEALVLLRYELKP